MADALAEVISVASGQGARLRVGKVKTVTVVGSVTQVVLTLGPGDVRATGCLSSYSPVPLDVVALLVDTQSVLIIGKVLPA